MKSPGWDRALSKALEVWPGTEPATFLPSSAPQMPIHCTLLSHPSRMPKPLGSQVWLEGG